ncbi:MAG TPA: VWA domain-containing protein, partial [Candidatus Limnocylindrales bacterium]|nr:VWA domain-containing protein [Candidatus Limnocylindrales bacterium]
MRTLLLVFVIAFIPLSLFAQQEAAPPAVQQNTGKNQVQDKDQVPDKDQGKVPVFRKNVNVVNILVTVKDKHGALIPNLSKDHFELLEDGKPQTIKYFSTESDVPITLGLLIDSSKSMERTLPEEKVVASGFLQKVLTGKDLAFVISFDISVDLLQDLTGDLHLLRGGLNKARINTNTVGMSPMGGSGPVPTAGGQNKGTLLFDAVYLAADEVLSRQVGRKAMVILTDGDDVGSKLRLKDSIEAAQRADTVAYVLLITDPMYPSNYGDMSKLTEQTGGRLISVSRPDKLDKAFAEIAAELRSQYLLGFSSTNPVNDGKFRRLEVKSKDGYKIQAR